MSLFSGCLAICFAVVTLPHLFPCPVDKTQFNDSPSASEEEPTRRRRRRKQLPQQAASEAETEVEDTMMGLQRPKRECPVPKPSGLIAQVMGFSRPLQEELEKKKKQMPSVVVVQTLRERRVRGLDKKEEEEEEEEGKRDDGAL
jgi:cytochrome c oxidase assembly factor 2